MRLLGDMTDRRAALSTGSLCGEALALFIHDPDCRALAVADNGRPVGLIARDAFLARMESQDAETRPLTALLDGHPLTGDAGETVADFVERAMAARSGALLTGFLVTRGGVYEGVCDLARLLPAITMSAGPDALAGLVCAELRAPLADVRAAVDGLSKLRLPANASAYLETIDEAALGARDLIETAALLELAEGGRLQFSPSPMRLHDLTDSLEGRWRRRAEAAGVTFVVAYDGPPDAAALVDPSWLGAVFDALIAQAVAKSGRGVVEASLHAREVDGKIALTARVRDAGRATQAAVGASRRRVAEAPAGVRLKLQLAGQAIAAMGGQLRTTQNRGPGATAAFELRLPPAEAAPARADRPQEDAPRRAHVLVVDDNATNRMVVEALCEMFECSTESVTDGVEAVEAARTGRFDMILMDIKMPRMDGVTATRQIRQLPPPAGRLPIIALTANADAEDVARYLAAGMLCVVEKPIKPDALLSALQDALASAASQLPAAAA